MSNGNRRKDELLGEPHGTANGKLRKAIIFWLAGRCGMLTCFRCGVPVKTVNDLSIEHKDYWQFAADPRSAFFDLANIAFSHLRCNVQSNAGKERWIRGMRTEAVARRKSGEAGTAWCARHRTFLPIERFNRNASRWNGVGPDCTGCANAPSRRGRQTRKRSELERGILGTDVKPKGLARSNRAASANLTTGG